MRRRKYGVSRRAARGVSVLLLGAVLSIVQTAFGQERAISCEDGTAGPFACSNVDLLSRMDIGSLGGGAETRLNDVWGWTDPDSGREYALVGRTDGTAIVDVTNPVNPMLVASVPTRTTASVWRDIKVYADHALIVADIAGWHGMQIVDLRRLRSLETTPATLTPDAVYDGFGSAHNVVVNEASGFAYAVGISTPGVTDAASCGGGLHMIDVRDPVNPAFAGCFADTRTGRQRGGVRTGYTHDAQCIMYHGPDVRYRGREICLGANETAISIADVTDKADPVAISVAAYPDVGYAHQGWLTDDHRYFFLDDELDESYYTWIDRTRTIIFDLVDLEAPVVLAEYFGEAYAIDHNQYVVGNRVFQANYTSGLRVLDITDVAAPVEVGYFVTYLDHAHKTGVSSEALRTFHRCHDDCDPGMPMDPALSFSGAWSVYPFFESGNVLVSSIDEGLFVLDASDAVALSTAPTTRSAPDISVHPNPASEVAAIHWDELRDVHRVAVYDIVGRRVLDVSIDRRATGTLRVDVGSLAPGLYFVRAEGSSAPASTSLVVVR